MAFLSSVNVVGSGLTAQQQRLDVISENVTNINTTRTEGGGPYRRKMVVLEEENSNSPFRQALDKAMGRRSSAEGGVRGAEIAGGGSDFKLSYDPENPDANEDGYVELPNVDLVKEISDAMAANQAYSANVTAFNVLKQVIAKGLEIAQ